MLHTDNATGKFNGAVGLDGRGQGECGTVKITGAYHYAANIVILGSSRNYFAIETVCCTLIDFEGYILPGFSIQQILKIADINGYPGREGW